MTGGGATGADGVKGDERRGYRGHGEEGDGMRGPRGRGEQG